MNHYERLEVRPDATEDEIKRAYRAKARENHPDKGGRAEEFASIAAAYEVLTDPSRRLLYDTTGQDQRTPIEAEVQQILLNLFNEALSGQEDISLLAFVRDKMKLARQQIIEERKKLKERRKQLELKRIKITSTDAVNLAHMVIDGQIKAVDAGLAEMDHQEEIQRAVTSAIEAYSEEWEDPKPTRGILVYQPYGSATFDFRL